MKNKKYEQYDNIENNISDIDNEIYDDISNKIINELDEELLELFYDSKILNRKNIKKNKNNNNDLKVGQSVKIKNKVGKVIFGPYKVENKVFYEIELNSGDIITEELKNIEKL